jgi:hypothetical protein
MVATVSAVDAVQRLLDESAIRRVLARYSWAIDRRHYELLRTGYLPHAALMG